MEKACKLIFFWYNMQITAELMNIVTCLSGLYLGSVVFELWTNEHNRVLHRTKQSTHIFTAVQGTRGQDGLSRCEKFLPKLQKARWGNEYTICVCMCKIECVCVLYLLP